MPEPSLTLELSADIDILALPLETRLVRATDPQTHTADIVFQLALITEKWKGQGKPLQLSSLTSQLLGAKASKGLGTQFKLEEISLSTFAAEVFIQKKSFTIVAAIDTSITITQIVKSDAVFNKANAESKQPFSDADKKSVNLGVFIQKQAGQKPIVCFFVYQTPSDGSDDLYTISSTPGAKNATFVSLEAKLDRYPRICSLPELPPTDPTDPTDPTEPIDWLDWIEPLVIGAGAVAGFLEGLAGGGEAGAAGGLAGLISKILSSGAGRVPGAGGEPVGESGNASGSRPNPPFDPPPPVTPILGIGSARVGIDLGVS